MRWRDREWSSGWRFAFWPMLVGQDWMWLEWYWMERITEPKETDDVR